MHPPALGEIQNGVDPPTPSLKPEHAAWAARMLQAIQS
jgi:hypothetical protein